MLGQILIKAQARSYRNSVRMIAYGGSVIRQIGTCTLQVRHKGNEHSCVFYVTDSTGPALIGLPSCCELGLVKLQYAIGYTTPHSNQEMRKWILHEYGDVFKGIGRFSGEYHIEVDTSVPPVIHPPRRVPHALREPLRQELNSLVEKGILRQVTKATSWVNSFVCVTKPRAPSDCAWTPKTLIVQSEDHTT